MTSHFDAQSYWDQHARRDPLWAILSEPDRTGRRWDLPSFLQTGEREISLLMHELQTLGVEVDRAAALDFGCGVGRLTQPLAQYFDRVVGVDVSLEMIRLAHQLNAHRDRVQYMHNAGPNLCGLGDDRFSFIYSNVVLQHVPMAATFRYLYEFVRVLRPGGVLVFQLPADHRTAAATAAAPRRSAMPAPAYRARIEWLDEPSAFEPGAPLAFTVRVTNVSEHAWVQADVGPIALGNHWLSPTGAMLIQDDGRAMLPARVGAGESCEVRIAVSAPDADGDHHLELDLVHEGVTWFVDHGSEPSSRLHVTRAMTGSGLPASGFRLAAADAIASSTPSADAGVPLALDEAWPDDPGPLPMQGIHRPVIEHWIRYLGATLLQAIPDDRGGPEWTGYRYVVRKR